MHKVISRGQRYYANELNNGDFDKILQALWYLNDAKIKTYNLKYDKKFNPDQYETQINGGTETAWCKYNLGLNDYYCGCINQLAGAMLSSQMSLLRLNRYEQHQKIAACKDKLDKVKGDLDKKLAIKKSLLIYLDTGKFPIPYEHCSTHIAADGTVTAFKTDAMSFADYERKIDSDIRNLKARFNQVQHRMNRMQTKLDKHHISRVTLGSKAFYRQKDTVHNPHWKEEFHDKRCRSITLSGRHTSKFGNFLVKYNYHTKELEWILPKNLGSVTFKNFKLVKHQDLFEQNFKSSRDERKSVCYTFTLHRDGNGRRYIVPAVMLELPEKQVNHGFSDGCIAADLNADHIAWADISATGELLNHGIIPFSLDHNTTGQNRHIIGNVVGILSMICADRKKPLVIEDLDLSKSKTGMQYDNKKKNRILSVFAYQTFRQTIEGQAYKHEYAVYAVNPAYTSFIGKIKYMRKYGITIHESAAYTIGLKGMEVPGYNTIPAEYKALVTSKNTDKQVAELYKLLKKVPTNCFYKQPVSFQDKNDVAAWAAVS